MDEKLTNKTKKVARSTGRKVLDAIFRGEDLDHLIEYIWKDEIMPWIGDSLQDVCGRVIGAIFYDDDYIYERSSKRRRDRDRHDYTSHSKKNRDRSRSRRRDDDDDDRRSDLGPKDTDLAWFDTMGEAENCRYKMVRLIKSKGRAEVRDFYSEANIVTTNFTVQDWGWTDANAVRRALIRENKRDGKWYIYMPKPEELEEEDYDD